ncbi:MAG: cell division protein [Planctomycetota bacterium]|nr:MAG: cell division protein [Planctomycetota bacterium]
MIKFEVITEIEAPPSDCFDLSRDLDFHQDSFGHTKESIVGGRPSGLIEWNEEVTWRAKHFGFYHQHTSRITVFDAPHHFRDEMTEGRFKKFMHDHYFEATLTGTRMKDVVEFQAPMGVLGRVVEVLRCWF